MDQSNLSSTVTPPKRLLTVKEVAKRLRLKPATVQKRIRDGELPAIKEGRSYLVCELALQVYLDQKRR